MTTSAFDLIALNTHLEGYWGHLFAHRVTQKVLLDFPQHFLMGWVGICYKFGGHWPRPIAQSLTGLVSYTLSDVLPTPDLAFDFQNTLPTLRCK